MVLLDQKMPGMEGLDVLRQIKALAPAAQVIMVTAFSSVELAVSAMKLGAVDFVRKPTTPEIIRNAVNAALTKRQGINADTHSTTLDLPARPPGRSITLNGFTISRAPDAKGAPPASPAERRFIVRGPDGREQEVVIEIDEEAVKSVERLARRRLPVGRAFLTEQAERFLNAFLWNDGKVPPGGRLTLKGIDREDLDRLAQDFD